MRNLFMKHLHYILTVILTISVNCSFCQIKTLTGKQISKTDIDKFIQQQIDTLHIKGISIAIINDGKVVYAQTKGIADLYKGTMLSSNSIFEAASMGKPLFASFVMLLVEKKVLSLDTPLYKYLPYPDIAYDDRYKLITARMVLDHTTGFPNWRENDTLKIMFTPGSKFSYSGEGFEYLAKVVEHLTNCTPYNFDSLFQKEVGIPLKMEHSGYSMTKYIANNLASGHEGDVIVYEPSDKYAFHPAGGLYSYPPDYANFLIAMINNTLLSKQSEDEMLKPQIALSDSDNQRKSNGVTAWGLGFSIKPTPYGNVYMHGGNNWGYTSASLFNKEKKFGYVFFTNTDQCNGLKKSIDRFLTSDK